MNRCRLGSLSIIIVFTALLAYGAETKQAKIKRALSAAPPQIAKSAKVVDMDAQGKMEVLYNYLSSDQFKQRIEGIVEPFMALREQLESEERTTYTRWSHREKQLTVLPLSKAIEFGVSSFGGALRS